MRREYKNIFIDMAKRKRFLKNEIKKKILKSIFQNRYVSNNKRLFIQSLILEFKKKSSISFQKKRCLLTGQSNAVYKQFEVNRHMIKHLNNEGMVQNITLKK
jgi:ribosomal protein S14